MRTNKAVRLPPWMPRAKLDNTPIDAAQQAGYHALLHEEAIYQRVALAGTIIDFIVHHDRIRALVISRVIGHIEAELRGLAASVADVRQSSAGTTGRPAKDSKASAARRKDRGRHEAAGQDGRGPWSRRSPIMP